MNWFDYLIKAPVGQMVTDWREFVCLRKALVQAEKDMVAKGSRLVHYYGVNDDMNHGNNVCLKSKRIVDGIDVLGQSPCCFFVKRCSHFAPEGNEHKCPNNLCAAWKDNNSYCDSKQRYNDLKSQYETFWAKRFDHVK